MNRQIFVVHIQAYLFLTFIRSTYSIKFLIIEINSLAFELINNRDKATQFHTLLLNNHQQRNWASNEQTKATSWFYLRFTRKKTQEEWSRRPQGTSNFRGNASRWKELMKCKTRGKAMPEGFNVIRHGIKLVALFIFFRGVLCARG